MKRLCQYSNCREEATVIFGLKDSVKWSAFLCEGHIQTVKTKLLIKMSKKLKKPIILENIKNIKKGKKWN